MKKFLIVSDFNESQAVRIHLTIIFRSGDFKFPASVTAVTTNHMTAKILSAELKKRKEKYKHFVLRLLTEKACSTPVSQNLLSVFHLHLILPTVYSNERLILGSGGALFREGVLFKKI